MQKRLFVVALVLALFVVGVSARGDAEMGTLRIRSQIDDLSFLMKVGALNDLYDPIIIDVFGTDLEDEIELLQLRFSDDIDAYNAMEPHIWETDTLFAQRKDKEYFRLSDAMLAETKRLSADLLAVTASRYNEMGTLRIRSQIDDLIFLIKVMVAEGLYDPVLFDEFYNNGENFLETILLRFSEDFDAYTVMEQNSWETDTLFEERKDKEYFRLSNAILAETKRYSSELLAAVASDNEEMRTFHMRSQSDDVTVLKELVASVDLYDTFLLDELESKYEETIQTLQLRFSDDIYAYNTIEPHLWETDTVFEERKYKGYSRLSDTILAETKRLSSELVAVYDQQKGELYGYIDNALANLTQSHTLSKDKIALYTRSYVRNTRQWYLYAFFDDTWVSSENLSLVVDFTSIGDEMKIREEIIQFDEAVNTKVLQASLQWHFIRDFALDRFLLVIDQVSITNPLSGGTYTFTLNDSIPLKSYLVSEESDKTLIVEDATYLKNTGISNLSYQDRSGDFHTLNSPDKALTLSWNILGQPSKPIAPAVPAAPVDVPEPAIGHDTSKVSTEGKVNTVRERATTVQVVSLFGHTLEMVFPVKISSGPELGLIFFEQTESGTIPLTFVEGGSFQMGTTVGDWDDEELVHTVKVDSFSLSTYLITQDIYEKVMGYNPSSWTGTYLPVEQVSWFDAVAFCNALSRRDGLPEVYTIKGASVGCDWNKKGYRLPTEAEWEYAARGGSKSQGYTYAGSNTVGDVAWYEGNSGGRTHNVGGKRANELGLFDMSGNVWEWCWDWYGSRYYSSSPGTNPKGPSSGSGRVLRGGHWYSSVDSLYVSFRDYDTPWVRDSDLGFRVLVPTV
ncbi:MAG: formylglycine-generating enzyme family protein [Sphaerochaeta sp.]|nr:formylglycine-generating enzyme family protein [Sphaerochaeta sp.]